MARIKPSISSGLIPSVRPSFWACSATARAIAADTSRSEVTGGNKLPLGLARAGDKLASALTAAMNIEHLVTMANQIAANFEAWPDHGEACNEVANHLKRFWDPRMRRQIIEHAASAPAAGLSPLALEAIRKLA